MIAWLAIVLLQTVPAAPAQDPSAPSLPDWARLNPYGFERQQCSPLARPEGEGLRTCQNRIRHQLAQLLGDDLPPGLTPFEAMTVEQPTAAAQSDAPAGTVTGERQGPSWPVEADRGQDSVPEAMP